MNRVYIRWWWNISRSLWAKILVKLGKSCPYWRRRCEWIGLCCPIIIYSSWWVFICICSFYRLSQLRRRNQRKSSFQTSLIIPWGSCCVHMILTSWTFWRWFISSSNSKSNLAAPQFWAKIYLTWWELKSWNRLRLKKRKLKSYWHYTSAMKRMLQSISTNWLSNSKVQTPEYKFTASRCCNHTSKTTHSWKESKITNCWQPCCWRSWSRCQNLMATGKKRSKSCSHRFKTRRCSFCSSSKSKIRWSY